MFDQRLKVLLAVFAVSLMLITGRLVQLQVVHAAYYSEKAERSFLLRPQSLPFVRGSILDRTGRVLVADEPSWNLTIDYPILAADVGDDPSAYATLTRRWKRHYAPIDDDKALAGALRADISRMWAALAYQLTTAEQAVSIDELRGRAREIHERVQRIRAAVARRRGFDSPVAEEQSTHALMTRMDTAAQIAAREALADFPWLHIEPATARTIADGTTSMAHVLGRLGRVDAETVAADPWADDPFARYRADEPVGISGVEVAAEAQLRGRRGQITYDRDREVVDLIDAENGSDVTLTIDADLQDRLYYLLDSAVSAVPESAGGAIVVLDVPRREVLALVSYPSFDPQRFDETYAVLRDDTVRLPLWFRAVASRYAPGSTIKPLVGLAGLISGRINVHTSLECTGYLFPDQRDRWRCWEVHDSGMRMAHGSVGLTAALTGSCNVFMYRVGEMVGVDRLCDVFDMAGIGRRTGSGLREEVPGINPTPEWLARVKDTRAGAGHARQFAMGQGEISMTPLQVANLMATYADGEYRPVTLLRGTEEKPRWVLPSAPGHWHAVREGIFGVVNEPEGTAYKYAHFVDEHWVLCGKTGSATAYPWPTAYRVAYQDVDGTPREAVVPAGSAGTALERFAVDFPGRTVDRESLRIESRWPTLPPSSGEHHAHAWFGGFLQRTHSPGRPDWSLTPRIAFAVLVEFGGSGGRTSGPLAKEVCRTLLEVYGPALEVDGGRRGGR